MVGHGSPVSARLFANVVPFVVRLRFRRRRSKRRSTTVAYDRDCALLCAGPDRRLSHWQCEYSESYVCAAPSRREFFDNHVTLHANYFLIGNPGCSELIIFYIETGFPDCAATSPKRLNDYYARGCRSCTVLYRPTRCMFFFSFFVRYISFTSLLSVSEAPSPRFQMEDTTDASVFALTLWNVRMFFGTPIHVNIFFCLIIFSI